MLGLKSIAARGSNIAKRLCRDRRGNVAMIVAVAAIPTFAFLGWASDYGTALSDKTKLDAAADAASMAAITTAKAVVTNSQSYGSGVTQAAISQGQSAGSAAFAANAGSIGFASVPAPTVTVTRVNQTLTATVQYATTMKANFSSMIGIPTLQVKGTSTSTLTMPTYINYYIIVDASQSMGIGSTAADMQTLYNRVVQYNNGSDGETGCVFGCHVQAPSNGGNGKLQTYTNEYLAHSILPAVTLRIDAAATAIQTIISQAKSNYTGQNLIQLSLYTMQQDPNTGNVLTTLAGLEGYPFINNTTATTKLDLGNNNSGGAGDSNFSASLQQFVSNLSTQGDGSTQSAALNYVFIITDGVSDIVSGCGSCHKVGALDPTICAPIKQKATMGVLYTTYNPIYNNNNPANGLEGNYAGLVGPIAGNIVPNLQTCASSPTSQWYFEATDGPSITTGMQQLFKPTAQVARLSY